LRPNAAAPTKTTAPTATRESTTRVSLRRARLVKTRSNRIDV
jgi:hypothetical protein